MKRLYAAFTCAALVLGTLAPSALHAQQAPGQIIKASAAWARATPRNAPVAGAYLTLQNLGSASDRLVSAASPAANRTEIHQMRREGDVMVMRPLPEGLEIRAGEQIVLSPGGYHLMLTGLKAPLVDGDKVHVTLTFQSGAVQHLDVPVLGMGAQGPPLTLDQTDAMQEHHHH
jgi:copper(I)-binding protein